MADFNINKEVVGKLRFQPEEAFGNLCRGYLKSVECVMHDISKTKENGDISNWEFAGYSIPTLSFKFEQHKATATDKDRYFEHYEKVIGNVKSAENGGGNIETKTLDALYESMWSRIKHIHDCFVGKPNYKSISSNKEVEKAGKTLYSNYADAAKTTETTLKAFEVFFTAIAKAFNEGEGKKDIFTNVLLWIKVVSEYKSHKYLVFPTFTGTGFVEAARDKVKSTLTFSPSESVLLQASKATAPTTPTVSNDLSPELKAQLGMV